MGDYGVDLMFSDVFQKERDGLMEILFVHRQFRDIETVPLRTPGDLTSGIADEKAIVSEIPGGKHLLEDFVLLASPAFKRFGMENVQWCPFPLI